MKRLVLGLLLGGLAFGAAYWESGGSAAAQRPPAELSLERIDIETAQPTAEACLVFSQPLDGSGATQYGDYLAITPAVQPALRVDGTRLCLAGLAFGVAYELELREGLPAAGGIKLAVAKKTPLELRDRAPLLAFRDGLILPRENAAGVPITTINVDRIAIKVLRVPDRLMSQIRGDQLAQRQAWPYQLNELETEKGALVWRGELATSGHRNETVTTLFPLRQAITERKPGAYVLIAEDAAAQRKAAGDGGDDDDSNYHPRAVQWVIDSDIGLTSFQGADGLHVFARSLASAAPLSGLTLSLVARDNEELAKSVTDASGHVRFDPGLMRGQGGGTASVVMGFGAEGDFAVQDITRPAFDLSDRGVEGRALPGPVDAFLYTERGIYRPRETVEIVALLRDRLADAIADTPVTLVVKRPDGAVYRRAVLPDQAVGAVRYSLALSETAAHGHWVAEAYLDPKGDAVGHVEFDVEDFVPQRLKVSLASAQSVIRPGAALQVDAEARFLYGAAAADLEGDAEARIAVDPDPFPAYRGYRFGLAQDSFKEKVLPLDVATTDAAGKTSVSGTLTDIGDTSLPLKADIAVKIFEPGGRSTDNTIRLPVRTRPLAIGIHPLFTGGRVQEDSEAGFEIIALDEAGQRVSRSGLAFQLVKEITEYTWYRSGRGYQYERATHDLPVVDGTLDVGADVPAVFRRVAPWGYYRLTVIDRASGAATSLRFSAGWRGVLAEDRPDRAEVSADKERYAVGDTARIAIRPPAAGQALLVIASDRVLATRLVTLPAEGATVEVPVTAEWGTGAYAVVAAYRPLGAGNERTPVRAIGVSWLPIEAVSRTLTIALGAPDKTLPRHGLAVPVTVSGGAAADKAYVTLAAVDEGILQLTRFVSPSPPDYYFGKRRLAVDIRDDYGRLIDAKGMVGELHVGGDTGGRALEVVPTRTVALFSGLVALDAGGHATIPLEIPDFTGELRLMAVAFDAHRVGMAEGHLTVRDPVVSDVVLPRFLAPGDHSRLSLNLHNIEGEAGIYRARLTASGAVAFPQESEREVDLPVGKRELLAFALDGKETGIGTIDLHVSGPGGFAVDRQWQIAVRPPQLPIAHESVGVLTAGKELTLDPQMLDELLPGTGTVTIGFDSVRTVPIAGLLRSLDRYPFGCVEQVTSRAFPLLFYNDLARLTGTSQDSGAEGRVQAAIATLLDMQRIAGNFGLWAQRGAEAYDWLSVYAIDFLVQARSKNYQVPEDALDRARAWLRRTVQDSETLPRTRDYAAYVLTKANALALPDLRYVFDTAQGKRGKHAFATAQLGAALAMSGDRARAQSAFATAEQLPLAERNARLFRFYDDEDYYASALRDWAGLVTMAAEAGETAMLTRLFDRYQWVDEDSESLTTQEKAWLLIAMNAMAQRRGPLSLVVDGTAMTADRRAISVTPDAAALARGYVVRNQSDREIWQTVSVSGIPRAALPSSSSGITIDREFRTLDGAPADLDAVRQNDRLVVILRGATEDARRHEVALLDLLPAGFEIEGVVPTDEKGETPYKFLGKQRVMRLKDARDDRFVASFVVHPERYGRFFAEAGEEETPDYTVAYIVRAVTPGTYVLPAATAEDMYRPAIKARTAMGAVTILPRQ